MKRNNITEIIDFGLSEDRDCFLSIFEELLEILSCPHKCSWLCFCIVCKRCHFNGDYIKNKRGPS